MKKIILTIFVMLLISAGNLFSQTGWYSLSTGSSSYLTSLYFIDVNTGYIGGNNGFLSKTTNGGANWTTLTSGISSGFVRSIFFSDVNTGYICGDNGTIRKTTNGGVNWTSLSTGAAGTFYGLSGAGSNLIVASNNDGKIYRSTDGGLNFSSQQIQATGLLTVEMTSGNTGYTAGQGGGLYKTTDGGNSWSAVNSFTTNNIWDISFKNDNLGWFNAYYGTIRMTHDGGTNIIPNFGFNQNFEGISTINKMICYQCGLGGLIMKATDGGNHWYRQESGTTTGLNEIQMINANTGYIVTSSGNVLKTTDGGGQPQFLKILRPVPNEMYRAGFTPVVIEWTSNNVQNVSIEYSTNNGSSWQFLSTSYPADSFKYTWNTGYSISGTNFRIRIKDVGSSLQDTSGAFRIANNIVFLFKEPEALYLKFNKGSNTTPNYAIPGYGNPLTYVDGHTLSPGGMYDSALVGGGNSGSTYKVLDSASLYLPASGWTIGFWVSNISLGTTPTNPVYLFGEPTSTFRIYYGGSGGLGTTDTAIMVRKTGAADVRIPVVKGTTYYIHIAWDPASSAIKVYRFGTLFLSVPQSTPYVVVGNGPVSIGAYSTLSSSLSSGMKLDEFRVYNRLLTSSEISQTYLATLPAYLTVGIKNISSEIPDKFSLEQNYPNPFNSMTNVKFQIKNSGIVVLKVFDLLGREVRTLVNENKQPGTYQVSFYAEGLSSGIYFYKMTTDNFSDVKRMILIQ